MQINSANCTKYINLLLKLRGKNNNLCTNLVNVYLQTGIVLEHLEQSGMNVAINTVGGLVINIISHLLSTYTMSILVAYETENIDNF